MSNRMKLLYASLACTAAGVAASGLLPIAGIVWGD
ncbi:MAG: hypothetical protein QOG63_11 [Thermoleophilaceae bacterium]|jgi:hypothetical protein|nr:hypothetical protein [Thermoleophilaceae bacterium]